MVAAGQGPLVYVMGPSGAGKDSVLNRARALLAADTPVVFAHRYITRPAEAGGENHVALSPAEFALRRAHGLFAFHWQAHGNEYGIGREIHAWRKVGLTVVVSGSREHFQKVNGGDDETHPVLITAPAGTLAERTRSEVAQVLGIGARLLNSLLCPAHPAACYHLHCLGDLGYILG